MKLLKVTLFSLSLAILLSGCQKRGNESTETVSESVVISETPKESPTESIPTSEASSEEATKTDSEEENTTSIDVQTEYRTDEFVLTDFFVPEHPVLKDHFYRFTGIDEIIASTDEDFEISTMEKQFGSLTYYVSKHIAYASLSTGADAFILLSDKYSLGNGLRVGDDEKEILEVLPNASMKLRDQIDQTGTIAFHLGFENGPFPNYEYDKIYTSDLYYNDISVIHQYLREHGVEEPAIEGGQSVLCIVVKDGRIVAIVADIPV